MATPVDWVGLFAAGAAINADMRLCIDTVPRGNSDRYRVVSNQAWLQASSPRGGR